METKTPNTPIVRLVLRAVALAMGIAVIVLGVLDGISASAAVTLLGIGLTALALDAFQ